MRERTRSWAQQVSWSKLAETLSSRRLLTALGPRIVEMADGRADDDFRAAVKAAVDAGHRHGTLLNLVRLRITAMLADAGIRSTALKGPRLGEAIYGEPGRRLSSDIDLLVAPQQLAAAVDVVHSLGYGGAIDHLHANGLPLLHFALAHGRDELPPVELHWRIHWYEERFAVERLLTPSLDPHGDWQPAPGDELAALLLFYARDGFIDLRLASDLSAWWDVYGTALHAGALDELLHAYPALSRALSAAARVAERVVGVPTAEIITPVPRPSLRGGMAVRLANPHPHGSQSQLYADIGLIDGLLSPPGQFSAFVRRQLLPSPEVLDQQARHASRRRARSRLSRFAGVLARYVVTAARLARPSETLP